MNQFSCLIYFFSASCFLIGMFYNAVILSGAILPPEKEKGEHFDSNCITPVIYTPCFFDAGLVRCVHLLKWNDLAI